MFVPSDTWTALAGNNVHQYTQPKSQFPFYQGLLGGVSVCDRHLLGLKGWYWAQAVAFWKAHQAMAQDNWMPVSEAGEVRYFLCILLLLYRPWGLLFVRRAGTIFDPGSSTPRSHSSHLPFPTTYTRLVEVISDIFPATTRTHVSTPRTDPYPYKTRSGYPPPSTLS